MTTDTGQMVKTAENDTRGGADLPVAGTLALTVLYGSQTGNAEFLASGITNKANAQGYTAEMVSLDSVTPAQAARKDRLLIVTATHDNGHMPDNAQPFWEALTAADPSTFADVPYAVLAIGDSMYEDFCKAGADLDRRLTELGGSRILNRMDCDVDYDFTSGPWVKNLLETFKTVSPNPRSRDADVLPDTSTNDEKQGQLSRKEPDTAKVVQARRLSPPASDKEVWHYELEVEGDTRNYRPGDSLAVVPVNAPELVDDLLGILRLSGEEMFDGYDKPVRAVLSDDLELRLPHFGLVARLAEGLAPTHPVRQLVDSGDRYALEDWLWGRDVLDVLGETQGQAADAREFIALLRPIQHRAYSISSSPLSDGNCVHLTVSSVRYEAAGRRHVGACSGYLNSAAQSGGAVKVFPLPARDFHMPSDSAADVIMIGPGVGLAPFRGFLRERDTDRAAGRNWLFFGDRHREPSWLYQGEIEELRDRGVLTHLSLAFSRDQEEKVYVQDRIHENGAELFAWLSAGAFVYVCGDKRRMAPDIDRALVSLVHEHGGMTEEAADGFIQRLKEEGRYVKDVY